jgi:hypothetical protein
VHAIGAGKGEVRKFTTIERHGYINFSLERDVPSD